MLTSDLAKELKTTIKELKSAAKEFSIKISSGSTDLSTDDVQKIKKFFGKGTEKKSERIIVVKKDKKPVEKPGSKKVKPVKKVKIKIKKVVKKVEETKEVTTSKPQDKTKAVDKDTKSNESKDARNRQKKKHYRHEKVRPKEKQISFRRKKKQEKVSSVPKDIDIMETISVSELAKKMNIKANEIIAKLMELGMMATINQVIDELKDKEEDLKFRPPIVTIMGHVDHGKTSLLDYIKSSNVAQGEEGGITQHIGAYKVKMDKGEIVFLDTPGHEAFTAMRNRGAQVTDIVILVVAANDGVMPQTIEALNHAKAAEVPIIVAVNKMDIADANPDRVKQQLSDHGLICEDWGGDTQFAYVSAITGDGVPALLEQVVLQAELMELKSNPDRLAIGTIIESRIDVGRGAVATVLIQNGTLSVGDNFVSGLYAGKVRALFDWEGRRIQKAGPATPIEVLGLGGVPEAGDPFHALKTERQAKQISEKRLELAKFEQAKNVKKITLDNLYDAIQEGSIAELKVVIKADVQGSVEAIKDSLEKLSTTEVKVKVIHGGTGAINEGDVMLAAASDAIIIGFHVRPNTRAMQVAEKEGVDIRRYGVIYDVIEEVEQAMEGLLKPILKEEIMGTAEVRQTFKVSRLGTIAGCMVTSGKINRNDQIRIFRDGVELYDGKLASLKRFKDDVKEVANGFECGIQIENYNDLKDGDLFEAYQIVKVAKKLGDTKKKDKKDKKAK